MKVENLNGHLAHVIEALHSDSGFDYEMPDLERNPALFPIRRSIVKDGQLMAAGLLKVDLEAYLFVNHEAGEPAERLAAIWMLQEDMTDKARQMGFNQIYCVLPPEVEKSFRPRLEHFGWLPDRGWTRMTYEL